MDLLERSNSMFNDVLTYSNRLPGDQYAIAKIDLKDIIDLVEKTLTTEELTKDYVDIKQASQILNNVSTKNSKKVHRRSFLKDMANLKMDVVTVTSNGGVKKLYKKELIVTISRILNTRIKQCLYMCLLTYQKKASKTSILPIVILTVLPVVFQHIPAHSKSLPIVITTKNWL